MSSTYVTRVIFNENMSDSIEVAFFELSVASIDRCLDNEGFNRSLTEFVARYSQEIKISKIVVVMDADCISAFVMLFTDDLTIMHISDDILLNSHKPP